MKNRLAICGVLLTALVLATGCAEVRVPQIDPSGQHVFVEPTPECTPSTRPEPLLDSRRNAQLTVAPAAVVVPVNSEVILLASVRGPENFLLTNERVEWSIAPGSVGQIVAVGRNGLSDILLGEFWRGKIDNSYAIGTTERDSLRLARGTTNPRDDVGVLPGQAWVSITSPIEGTTHVLVFAPRTAGWECQKRTATIQWLDAEWQFPPPAINPAGTRHTFTTTVLRRSSQCPCAGWRVRYQVVDGPRAAFSPSGAASVDVETNAAGQGIAEISQPQPTPGTNRVAIQIFRPALSGDSGPMLIASGGALMTWTSPQIGLRKLGPAVVGQGESLTYRILVSNPGDLAAEDVVVVDDVPSELKYVESHPAAELSAGKLRWRLGRLAARETRPLEATFRAQQLGSVTACASATAAGGLQARDCATTTVAGPKIEVKINGPDRATVGSEVTFEVFVSNVGPAAATNLTIRDSFQPGMEHAQRTHAIERDVESIAPGQILQVHVKVRVTRPGRLCHQIEIRGADKMLQASAEGCITAVEAGSAMNPVITKPGSGAGIPAPGPSPPDTHFTPTVPPPQAEPPIVVKVTGPDPAVRTVDDTALFEITVTNMGYQRLTNVKIRNSTDAELVAEQASAGWRRDGDSLAWMVDTLMPGRANRFQVQCRCSQASRKACDCVEVVGEDGLRVKGKACIEIRGAIPAPRDLGPPTFPPEPRKPGRPEGIMPRGDTTPPITPPGRSPMTSPNQPGRIPGPTPGIIPPVAQIPGLRLTVSDLNNPVNVGHEANYEVRVANNSAQSDQQVVVAVIVPPGMSPSRSGTSGPTVAVPDGHNLRFAPLALIAPGQELIYKVCLRAEQPGSWPIRFELTSQSVRQTLAFEKTTIINPP